MEKINKAGLKINSIKIFKGSILAIIISIISLSIYATILINTDMKDNAIEPVVIIISLISILIGSTISSKNIKKKGIINGALVGIIYIMVIYILSSIFITGFGLNIHSAIMIIGAIVTGMIGGIVGVNIR